MAIKKLQGEKERSEGVYYEFDTEADVLGQGGMGVSTWVKELTAKGVRRKWPSRLQKWDALQSSIRLKWSLSSRNLVRRTRRQP